MGLIAQKKGCASWSLPASQVRGARIEDAGDGDKAPGREEAQVFRPGKPRPRQAERGPHRNAQDAAAEGIGPGRAQKEGRAAQGSGISEGRAQVFRIPDFRQDENSALLRAEGQDLSWLVFAGPAGEGECSSMEGVACRFRDLCLGQQFGRRHVAVKATGPGFAGGNATEPLELQSGRQSSFDEKGPLQRNITVFGDETAAAQGWSLPAAVRGRNSGKL